MMKKKEPEKAQLLKWYATAKMWRECLAEMDKTTVTIHRNYDCIFHAIDYNLDGIEQAYGHGELK